MNLKQNDCQSEEWDQRVSFNLNPTSMHNWSADVQGLEDETAKILQKYGTTRSKTSSRSRKSIEYGTFNNQRNTSFQRSQRPKTASSIPSSSTKSDLLSYARKKNDAAKKIQQLFLRLQANKKLKPTYSTLESTSHNPQLRLFNEDGSVNLSLSAVVDDALKTHRFNNVPSILLHEHYGHGRGNEIDPIHKQRRFYSEEKKLISSICFTGSEQKSSINGQRKVIKPKNEKGSQGDLISIRDVPYPGMDDNFIKNDTQSFRDNMIDDNSREVCFNCWSSYNNTNCILKKNIEEGKSGPTNRPFCDKWGIRHLRQCYRCGEVKEKGSTDLSALRFAKDSRRKSAISDEDSHPISKSLSQHVANANFRARRRFHMKQWVSSLIACLKLNEVDLDRNLESGKNLREIGTKKNLLFLSARVHDLRDQLPQAPVTDTDNDEDTIIKRKNVLSESGIIEKKFYVPVEPVPKPIALYKAKRYEMPPTTKVRLNVDDEEVELYGFFGKARTENDMSIGGFSGEVIMMQRVLHYTPPEYGDFNIIETTSTSPPTLPETYVPKNTLIIEPKNLEYVERELQHTLNDRRPPTITSKVGIKDDERHYFGTNRPEQTGETGDKGFRTSIPSELPPVDSEIKTTKFNVSSDVVSPNTPKALPSMTTTTGLDYPFCEITSRQNTIEDLSYILQVSQPCTSNKPQTFTVITKQEPGKFMFKNDHSLPLGRLHTIVTRSWSFLQKKRIAKFTTRNGTPYWYDRRAGRTFWERPLCEEETLPIKEGGVVIGSRENSYLDGKIDFNNVLQSRSTIRKLILSQTDVGPKRIRKKNSSTVFSRVDSESIQCVDVSDIELKTTREELVLLKRDKSPLDSTAVDSSESGATAESSSNRLNDNCISGFQVNLDTKNSEELSELKFDSSKSINNVNDNYGSDSKHISDEQEEKLGSPRSSSTKSMPSLSSSRKNQPSNSMNSSQLVTSIADALGGMLKDFNNETDVLKLGVGLGLSLSAKGILNLQNEGNITGQVSTNNCINTITSIQQEEIKSDEESKKHLDKGIVFPSIAPSCVNGSVLPTTSETLCKKSSVSSPAKEENGLEQADDTIENEDARFNQPLNISFTTHKPFSHGESITKYEEGNDEEQGLEGLTKEMSVGFLEAISSTRVGKQHVDYIPSSPNLPQCHPVARVKPRSAGNDWMTIGFDPWSAGKELLSIEFVPFLIGSEETNNIIPLVAPKDSVSFLKKEIKENNIITKKFNQLSSFIRHSNYNEFELTLEEFGDTFPIDATDDVGNTLLMVSCQNGNKRMVKLCLRKGSDLNKQNTNGHTSLHYAFGYGFSDLGAYLISKGANDTITNAEGLTCYEGLRMEDISSL